MSYDYYFLTPCMHKTTALIFKGITRERHACFAAHYFFLLFVCVHLDKFCHFFVVIPLSHIFPLAESTVIYCAHFLVADKHT